MSPRAPRVAGGAPEPRCSLYCAEPVGRVRVRRRGVVWVTVEMNAESDLYFSRTWVMELGFEPLALEPPCSPWFSELEKDMS